MYQRPTIDALHKRAPNLKLKPGVFSDPSHFIAKPYTDETKKKGKPNQQASDISGRRDKMTGSSFENVFKGSTHMTSENDPASSVFDNENYGPEYVFNTNFNDLKPLEERVNRPPTRASIGEKSLHSRSDKTLESHEDSHKNMRRQSSVSSLQKRSFQKNLPSYENVYASDAENRDNSPNLRVNHMSNGAKPKGTAHFASCEGDSNRSHTFNRTRSLGKINPYGENTKVRTPEPSIMAYIEEKEEQAKLENVMKENMDLWNNSKRLSAELQTERNKALMLENELQALNGSIAEERAKYQEEFIKISQEIKKFQNIQNAYIKEKKSSQSLEQQLNVHEKALSDMTCFVRECLQTLLKELEIIIIKGDVAFEKNFKNQDFNPEDFFKFCSELKKPILQKLDAAEKQNFKFDWKTHDYDQLLRYNKELEKLRKAQDFKIMPNKATFEESFQKSLGVNNTSMSHNNKSPQNSILPQYNSSQSCARKNSLPRSINNSYKSNDHSTSMQNQDLNRSHESQQKADKYIPLNYRINLAEFNVQPESSKRDDHMNSMTEDSESKNFSKRRSVSVPKVHETDVSLQEILGGQISNPRLKDFSPVQQTFDNLLAEGIQPRPEQETNAYNVGDISTKQSEVSPLNRRGQFNELAQFSSQVDAGLDSIKSQILSRMSNIEARRRSSLEGARQFTLDINKVPSQELTHHDFVNRGITEKSMEETTPRTRVVGVETNRGEENLQDESEIYKEKPQSVEQSLNKSPMSGKGIAWSPVPKLNLMAYNNTEEKFGGLAKSGSAMSLHSNKEEKYQPEEEKTLPNEYQSLPYRSVHSRTPSHQSTASKSSGGDYAIANYEYEAQKENDLTFNCGDKIQILKKTDNGWWIGLCNNRIGYFPSNFVTLVPGNN